MRVGVHGLLEEPVEEQQAAAGRVATVEAVRALERFRTQSHASASSGRNTGCQSEPISAAKRCAGVCQPKVLRGLLLSRRLRQRIREVTRSRRSRSVRSRFPSPSQGRPA